MTKKDETSLYLWLNIQAFLMLITVIGLFSAQSQINKLKREQIRIYNRINYMERALTTKDKELEQYLIKEKMK